MAGKPFLRRGLTWAARVAATVGVALVLQAGGVLAATHYPTGSLCYDCHAVSKSKMVVGTHLIKKSDKTVALGITGSSTPIRCLFCHEKNAVSVTGRTEMRGVWDHFDATSTSKHPAYVESGFTPDALRFDCLDCHTGITLGVVSDDAGNARVHDIDAATQTLNLYGTLIGNPANAAAVSTATCQNAACHSDAENTTGGYTAPARHSFLRTFPGTTQRVVTINDSVNPTLCTDCHGRHNSYQNTSLITLRTDGTTSNNPGDPLATRVTPDKCGECHSQDDGGIYTGKGHGQSTISGGTVGCTACHTASVPHSFGAPSTNPLRFAFAENTTKQSAIRQQPPYNQVFSVCLTCHGQYAGKEHGASAYAGCNDCHEPHGLGVLTNVKMIRRQIPKVNASGVPVYGLNSPTGTWEQNFYTVAGDTTFKTDGTGLCDNRECHEGRTVAGDLIYPLSIFLTGGRHSGGDIPTNANYDCETCHTHTDEGGSWGAKASCTTCHGQPPPPADSGYTTYAESNTPHQRHAAATDKGGYGYPCQACHFDYTSTLTHNTSPKTYQSLNFDVARNPSPARSYTAGTCTNLYCHSDGQRSTSVGSAQWMTGTSTPDWRTQDLACNSCHGTTTSPNTLTYGAPDHANGTGGHTPNSHNRHAAYACRVCHFDTLSDANPADGWTLATPPSAHVNNVKNLRADGTTATFTSTGTTPATCNNISCHNGGSAAWGATLGCSDCHFRTAAQGGDLDNFVYGDGTLSAVNSDEWTATGHGRPSGSGAYPSGNPAGNFAGPASDPRGCAYCHSFLGTANNPVVAHGVSTNPFRLANKSGAGEDGGWNNVCLVCHKTGDSGYDPDGAAANYASRNGARNVDENHYGVKHTAASKGGTFCWDCHDPHGDDQHYMVQGGAGVTDVSDGLYGIPVTRRAVTGFDVAAGGYTSADLANAANTGLCQTCHAAAGGALYYNRSTFTALNLHNGADATRCTACHTHDGDFGAGCTACHGYPPPDSPFVGTTATWTSDKAATPSSLGAHNTHAAGATPYVSGDCNSTCHTAATHLTNKLTANMGVKAATVGASTGIYKYSTVNNFDNWLGGALPGTQSVVDDTCTNVSCHASTYSANSFRSAANPGYTRYWNQNLNCYACHAYDGVAAPAPRPTADKIATGSHGVHVDTYALACTNCHPSAGYTNAHKSGFVNFATNFGATRVPSATGGAYDADGIAPFTTVANLVPRENGGTGYFCADVYCHSGGEPRGPEAIAYRNDTRWTVVNTGDCGTCHAVDGVAGSGSLATNVHEKHVGSAAGQYGYACTACHATVVGGVKPAYTIASTALHVNGANNVAFATNEGTYATTGGTVAPDGGTCSATYCHSQGLDGSAPYTGTATAPVTTADWDAPQGTTGCGYCHGNPPAYANDTTIRPAATNLTKKNSHAAHANYTCDRCHYTTTETGTTIASLSAHANKAWEVAANTGAGVTFTVAVQGTLSDTAYTPTTCNTISCHGGGNAQWGAALSCADCHLRTTAQGGDLDNWNIADGTASMVNSDEWTAAGHGRSTAYPSGNPAGNFAGPATDPRGCAYCHSFLGTANNPLVTHGVSTNPFRIANKSGTGEDGGWNNVCLVCHKTGSSGYDPDGASANYASRNGARKVDENHYGTKHTAASKGGTFCWDCHDPHGDTQHYMVQGGAGVTDASDGLYGIPVTRRAVTGFDVAAGGYTSADLVNTNNTGLCQTCHASNGGALYYNRSTFTALNLHNGADATRCTACHTHSGDFGASCSGCHGDGNNQYWPANAASNLRSAYPNRAGRHQKHMDVLAQRRYAKAASALTGAEQTAICDMCHNDASGAGGSTHYPAGYTWTAAPADVGAFNQMWGTYANDADGAYTAATYGGALDTSPWTGGSSCSALDCHNSKTTGAGFEWYGATLTACTMCHTRATSGSNPSSGLHYGSTAPTVSGAWHDDTLTTTNKCVVCHTTLTTQSTHINGTFTGNGTLAADRTAMGLFSAYTNGGTDGFGSCAGAAVGGTGCHVGGDAGTWARKWDRNIHYVTTGAECAGCHGGFNNDWTFGTVANTSDGSVEHDRNWDGDGTASEVIGNHQNFTAATTCNICHVYADSPYTTAAFATYHRNNQITMNSTVGYQRTTTTPNYGCTNTCHSNNANHGLEGSGWTLQPIAGPALSCTSCHTGSGSGALAVGPTSSHTTRGRAAGYNTFNDCTDCHPGGGKGSTHSRTGTFSQSVTYVRNYIGTGQTMLGLNYSGHLVTTGVYGFFLGGSATIGTTNAVSEAEICWGCHTNTTYQGAGGIISEWGQNQKSATGNMTYNYGTVSSPNWVTASWTSAVGSFGYKTGPIRSTHTANPQSLGGPSSSANTNAQANPDTVDQIRCSYCHSVHGRLDSARTNIMTSTPYLRGAWLGNPYLEDGAPLTTAYPANTSTFRFGKVPRGSKARPGTGGLPTYGGYQIDHNNDWPMGTAGTRYTTAEFGGLCEICHGDGNGTFTAAEIGNLNVFDAQGVGWVSTANGHANSVAGAGTTGPVGRNIFDGRGGTTAFSNSPYQHFEGMTDPGDNGNWGFRDADSNFAYQPRLASGSTRNRLWSGGIPFWNQWGVFIRTTGAVQGGYHKFSCSKCHNPHASRLPKLMITNCLDTKHNTWDNFYQIASAPGINAGRSISNWTSAQNCHRLPGVANLTNHPAANDTRSDLASSFGRGWNTVTPW